MPGYASPAQEQAESSRPQRSIISSPSHRAGQIALITLRRYARRVMKRSLNKKLNKEIEDD